MMAMVMVTIVMVTIVMVTIMMVVNSEKECQAIYDCTTSTTQTSTTPDIHHTIGKNRTSTTPDIHHTGHPPHHV